MEDDDVGGVISSTLRNVGEPWLSTHFQLARFNDFVAVGAGHNKKSRQRAARLAISFTAYSADRALGSVWGESIHGLLTQARQALKVPVKIAHVSVARGSSDLKGTVGDALRWSEGSFKEAVEQREVTGGNFQAGSYHWDVLGRQRKATGGNGLNNFQAGNHNWDTLWR